MQNNKKIRTLSVEYDPETRTATHVRTTANITPEIFQRLEQVLIAFGFANPERIYKDREKTTERMQASLSETQLHILKDYPLYYQKWKGYKERIDKKGFAPTAKSTHDLIIAFLDKYEPEAQKLSAHFAPIVWEKIRKPRKVAPPTSVLVDAETISILYNAIFKTNGVNAHGRKLFGKSWDVQVVRMEKSAEEKRGMRFYSHTYAHVQRLIEFINKCEPNG